MQEVRPLVSIVIPCYNAERFLVETLDCVRQQIYSNIQLIVVNDGSKDSTLNLLRNCLASNEELIEQENLGVSSARNNGLKVSRGKFVLFLDADDLIQPNFVQKRVELLLKKRDLVGAGGGIAEIDEASALNGVKVSSINSLDDILQFAAGKYSCPSGYLWKSEVIKSNNIFFNERLQSSADKFFLIQMLSYGEIGLVSLESGSNLHYRVMGSSMSKKISQGLVLDQIQYAREVNKTGVLNGTRLKRKFYARLNYTIAASWWHLGSVGKCFKFCLKSLVEHPQVMLKLVFRLG